MQPIDHRSPTIRSRRGRRRAVAVIAAASALAACGGDDDDTGSATSTTSGPDTAQSTDTTEAPETTHGTETTQAPETTGAPETTVDEASGDADVPDLPDLATVRHGASLINISTEYDQGTWSGVNLLDGRPDRGWSASEPEGAFVIGIAHPTIQAIGIDTRDAQEDQYPGISAVTIEVERATDLSTFPDLVWEPVGVIELEPRSIGVLETPDLFAPVLRFRVFNGGEPDYVEIMEVMAWGDLTDATTALDTVLLADVIAQSSPNVALLGEDWAFAVQPDDTVLACSGSGATATLSASNGALVGTLTSDDGDEVPMEVGALAATLTAIVDPDGVPQPGWSPINPDGAVACPGAGEADGEVIVPDTVPVDQREVDPVLVVAAARGDLDDVIALLASGADPNVASQNDGWTPLLFAAEDGHTDIVAALLDAGARVDQGTDNGWTALMIASQNGHDDTVAALLDGGANARVGRSTNWTALHSATLRNHPGVVGQLIAAGAPLEAAEDGYTPLTIAAQEGNDAIATLLVDAGARVDGAPSSGPTPIYMAAQNGHASSARLLVDAGADPDAGGTTAPPIVIAAARGHGEVIAVLRDAGADLDQPRGDGMTALHWAAYNDDVETTRLLLDLGADPTATDDNGDTPLELAIRRDADGAADVLRGP